MKIRYANFEDMKEVSKINIDGWKSAYKGILPDDYLASLDYEAARKSQEDNFHRGFCCAYEVNNDEIVGFCKFGERQDVASEKHSEYDCELVAIYVKPNWRGKGIGKKIFNFVVAEFKRMGMKNMLLWVLEDNHPSREFYRNMGGEIVGTKEHRIGNRLYVEVGYGYQLA